MNSLARYAKLICPLALLFLVSSGCAKEMPELVLSAPFGAKTELSSLAMDSEQLVVVFLISGRCALSPLAARILEDLHREEPPFVGFAGVLIDASDEQARKFKDENELSYTVYGLSRRDDPLAWNDLVQSVGSRKRQLIGGTIVVLDSNRKVRYSVDGEKLREAPNRLERLLAL